MKKVYRPVKRPSDGEPAPQADLTGKADAFAKVMANVYASESPKEMRRIIQRPPRRWKKPVIFVVLFLCVGAAVGGFFFFTQAKRFTGTNVRLNLSLPSTIAAGSEITLLVQVDNRETVTLQQAELAITYPEGFSVLTSSLSPLNDAQNAFSLGTLSPGRGRQVEIHGRILGSVGTIKNFAARLSYIPATFNSEFTTDAEAKVTLEDSVLQLKLDGPLRLVREREVSYQLTYKNQSASEIEEARLQLTLPEGCTLVRSEPTTDINQSWTIKDIAAQADGAVTVVLSCTGEVGTLKEVITRIGVVDASGALELQNEQRTVIQLVQPEVGLNLSVNGSATDQTTTFGSTLNYVLQYSNATDETVRDVKVTLSLKGTVLDWGTLTGAQPQRADDQLTWTKEEAAALTELTPGESGDISFSVRVIASLPAEAASGLSLQNIAQLTGLSDELGGLIEATAGPLLVKVNTRLVLGTEARYYSADFAKIGDGPIPPQVGQTTRYRIFWSTENSLNDADGVTVKATIPADVFWTGRNVEASVGAISFNATDRSVNWEIGRITAGGGRNGSAVTASFELSITPTAAAVGKVVILTDGTTITGQDVVTGAKLSDSRDALTTNCDADQYAQGQGAVQPAGGDANTNAQ